MNKGNQSKTTIKYLQYLTELISEHHLVSYKKVNLKDVALLSKYFSDNKNTANASYAYMIKQLTKLGIISKADFQFIPGKKTYYYQINLSTLIEFLNKYNMTDLITENNFIMDYYFKDNESGSLIPVSLNTSTPTHSFNVLKVESSELFKKIDKKDLMDIKPFKFKNKDVDDVLLQDLTDYYALKIKYNNPVYMECLDLINWINANQDLAQYKMPLHAKYSGGKSFTTITLSARQYSNYAMENSLIRQLKLSKVGLDSEIDLHSAIFTVAKLLNEDEFDLDWDIKRELYTNYDNLDDVSKGYIKKLLYRLFFTTSAGQAWTKFTHPTKKGPTTKEEFYDLYNQVQSLTSGTQPYMYNIFIYESLFELLIIKEMLEKGYQVVNVYDCFYFNSNQVSSDKVKEIITTTAYNFNQYISSLNI